MIRYIFSILFLIYSTILYAENSLRIAAWGGEIPSSLISKFEKETGIKVYLSTFESNESLLVKLNSSQNSLYDLVTPSNYFVNQLYKLHLILPLDLEKIQNIQDIDSVFIPNKQDNQLYGLPFLWSGTGIFYNSKWIKKPPLHWQDLWAPQFKNELLLMDDTREVFSITLLALGFSPNDFLLLPIQKAFQHLLKLVPNIKLLASDAMPRIITDEDAFLGMAWNGDIVKAQSENKYIKFVYPTEGFIISSECFSIPINSKNIPGAYQFINFINQPQNAALITLEMGFPVTNQKAKDFLPKVLANNKAIYPDRNTLKHAIMQSDIPDETLKMYFNLWESFKLSF